MRPTTACLVLAAGCLAAGCGGAAEKPDAPTTPVELGKVPWLRDHGVAVARAKKTGKPLWVLFQEVPG
ncbi:MAG: thioredoxin family protein [Planctomycetales bacterium]